MFGEHEILLNMSHRVTRATSKAQCEIFKISSNV